jgi:SAM-dependent methyltransferase
MGFFPAATEVILQEHKFRAITGRALMIGRQNTGLTPEEALQLLRRNGLPLLTDRFELDKDTQHVTGRDGEITDRSFFAAFSNCSVEAIDVSDYEGAEIVHDLSVPIPDALKGQFDFIYDGSTLDNVFNVATAMQNIDDLLKPGGRCVLMNWSNSTPTAYAMLSPDWFMDFFRTTNTRMPKSLLSRSPQASHRGFGTMTRSSSTPVNMAISAPTFWRRRNVRPSVSRKNPASRRKPVSLFRCTTVGKIPNLICPQRGDIRRPNAIRMISVVLAF